MRCLPAKAGPGEAGGPDRSGRGQIRGGGNRIRSLFRCVNDSRLGQLGVQDVELAVACWCFLVRMGFTPPRIRGASDSWQLCVSLWAENWETGRFVWLGEIPAGRSGRTCLGSLLERRSRGRGSPHFSWIIGFPCPNRFVWGNSLEFRLKSTAVERAAL